MISETRNPADELRHIIAEGQIFEEALQVITNMRPEKLRYFLDETKSGTTRAPGSPFLWHI